MTREHEQMKLEFQKYIKLTVFCIKSAGKAGVDTSRVFEADKNFLRRCP